MVGWLVVCLAGCACLLVVSVCGCLVCSHWLVPPCALNHGICCNGFEGGCGRSPIFVFFVWEYVHKQPHSQHMKSHVVLVHACLPLWLCLWFGLVLHAALLTLIYCIVLCCMLPLLRLAAVGAVAVEGLVSVRLCLCLCPCLGKQWWH